MAGNLIQIGSTDGKIRIKTNGIVVAGAADPCCCGIPDPTMCAYCGGDVPNFSINISGSTLLDTSWDGVCSNGLRRSLVTANFDGDYCVPYFACWSAALVGNGPVLFETYSEYNCVTKTGETREIGVYYSISQGNPYPGKMRVTLFFYINYGYDAINNTSLRIFYSTIELDYGACSQVYTLNNQLSSFSPYYNTATAVMTPVASCEEGI
jgi:hypothetical protein